MRAAYHYIVAVNADGSGICTSIVTGGPNSDPNWIDLSYNNLDDVKYIFSSPSSVYFPTNTKNTLLPGTPFFQGGFPVSSIAGGTTSPPAKLIGNEETFFYFPYSAILKNDGTPYCAGPKEGMGIHVTQ
jgi:hypothetical protein